MQNPLPSMILRDTSIREQLSSSSIKDSAYFNGNSGYNSSTFSSRERDCSSPFLNSSSGPNNVTPFSNQLSSLGSRDNNSVCVRDAPPVHNSSRASNRFLYGGLDQRIIKQSSEDCRRLLQQVSVVVHRSLAMLLFGFSVTLEFPYVRLSLWLTQHALLKFLRWLRFLSNRSSPSPITSSTTHHRRRVTSTNRKGL
jgi:hypothetical protein